MNVTTSPSIIGYIRAMLRGSGQVMFQGNAWTGLLFLIGIFWGAYQEGQPAVAWGAVVGVIASTLILCAMLTTWVRTGFNNVMAPWKTNSFTFPFVFTTWLFLFAARMLHGMPPEYMSKPELALDIVTRIDLSFGSLIVYWLKGIAQVFLINSWVTGIFFLVALFISSRWAALWAAIGSAVSLMVVLLYQGAGSDIANGLYGFSPVLTAIALGCVFYKPNWRSAIWALLGIIVTVFIQAGMNAWMLPFGMPTLTGPFCLTTWLFLLPLYKFDDRKPDHSHWHKKKIQE